MLESMKADKKVLIMGGMVLGIIAIFVIAIIVIKLSSGGTLSYEKIENKLETAAEKYLKDNDSLLPKKIGQTAEVSSDNLVSGGYISDLTEYTEEGVICSAKVIVGKYDEDKYDYVADLDCGDAYKTQFLADYLIEEDSVTSGNGLYKMEDVVEIGEPLGIDDDGYDLSTNDLLKGYIYRGEAVNNWVMIDKLKYRIVKIDGNNDLMVVSVNQKVKGKFDDRYNSESQKEWGINKYALSRAYENITNDYNKNTEKEDSVLASKVAAKNVCIGARNADETITDGSIECSEVLKDQTYSLLPMFDVMNASLAEECSTTISTECVNYNYLTSGTSFWTMTPSPENTYSGYRVGKKIEHSRTDINSVFKYVVYLSNRVKFDGGTGTESDPYIIK